MITFPVCCRNFYFPNDLKLELEYWAQSGEFTNEELHQLMVAENKLYKVHPQSGTLQPGQSVGITFTYQHLFPGKEIVLWCSPTLNNEKVHNYALSTDNEINLIIFHHRLFS